MSILFSRRFSASLAASAEMPRADDLARGKVIAPAAARPLTYSLALRRLDSVFTLAKYHFSILYASGISMRGSIAVHYADDLRGKLVL